MYNIGPFVCGFVHVAYVSKIRPRRRLCRRPFLSVATCHFAVGTCHLVFSSPLTDVGSLALSAVPSRAAGHSHVRVLVGTGFVSIGRALQGPHRLLVLLRPTVEIPMCVWRGSATCDWGFGDLCLWPGNSRFMLEAPGPPDAWSRSQLQCPSFLRPDHIWWSSQGLLK